MGPRKSVLHHNSMSKLDIVTHSNSFKPKKKRLPWTKVETGFIIFVRAFHKKFLLTKNIFPFKNKVRTDKNKSIITLDMIYLVSLLVNQDWLRPVSRFL